LRLRDVASRDSPHCTRLVYPLRPLIRLPLTRVVHARSLRSFCYFSVAHCRYPSHAFILLLPVRGYGSTFHFTLVLRFRSHASRVHHVPFTRTHSTLGSFSFPFMALPLLHGLIASFTTRGLRFRTFGCHSPHYASLYAAAHFFTDGHLPVTVCSARYTGGSTFARFPVFAAFFYHVRSYAAWFCHYTVCVTVYARLHGSVTLVSHSWFPSFLPRSARLRTRSLTLHYGLRFVADSGYAAHIVIPVSGSTFILPVLGLQFAFFSLRVSRLGSLHTMPFRLLHAPAHGSSVKTLPVYTAHILVYAGYGTTVYARLDLVSLRLPASLSLHQTSFLALRSPRLHTAARRCTAFVSFCFFYLRAYTRAFIRFVYTHLRLHCAVAFLRLVTRRFLLRWFTRFTAPFGCYFSHTFGSHISRFTGSVRTHLSRLRGLHATRGLRFGPHVLFHTHLARSAWTFTAFWVLGSLRFLLGLHRDLTATHAGLLPRSFHRSCRAHTSGYLVKTHGHLLFGFVARLPTARAWVYAHGSFSGLVTALVYGQFCSSVCARSSCTRLRYTRCACAFA